MLPLFAYRNISGKDCTNPVLVNYRHLQNCTRTCSIYFKYFTADTVTKLTTLHIYHLIFQEKKHTTSK